ncbi:MAG: polyhydroxyalkanoate depolymerase [Alphaproteobacteria bacterium]
MLYHLHELQHLLATPIRLQAELVRTAFQSPYNVLSYTPAGRTIGATAEMIERMTRRFGRPAFGLNKTTINGKSVTVEEEIIAEKPFCNLLRFKRNTKRNDPKVLLVAPMSGHYATLMRGTVEALLPHHDMYITDWEDARQVSISEGTFNLDDYITYLREFMSLLGPQTHVIAVCQPAVPVLAAISLMASEKDPNQPLSMTLMGGPIDTRVSKTEVTELAETRPLRWFEKSVIHNVPFTYPGSMRRVYPGFLQLSGFMSMNLDTHIGSHMKFFHHLISGDGESSEKHRNFYNEYLSVMDIPAEFYLQTVAEVFQKHSLPRGIMKWRDPYTDKLVDVRPQDIEHTALLTIEGELDDISARGQTTAAHEICHSLSQRKQYHHFQLQCGHYGIFNGKRYREQVMPRIRNFIRKFDKSVDPIPDIDLKKTPDLAPERFDHDQHGIIAIRRWLKEHQPESYKDTKIPRAQYGQQTKLVPPPQKKTKKTKPRKSVTADLLEPLEQEKPKNKKPKATKKTAASKGKTTPKKKAATPKATKKKTVKKTTTKA